MDFLFNAQITVSSIVGVMAKLLMGLLTVLALVMLKQTTVMDRVVNLPIGGNLRLLAGSFFGLMMILTVIVILV